MKFLLFIFLLLGGVRLHAQPLNLYLIPGTATDTRVFRHFEFDTTLVNPIPIKWDEYQDCDGMEDYAMRLMTQMDTSRPFGIVGVSFGGMLAKEICEVKRAECVILISTALQKEDVRPLLRFGKYIPVYQLLNDPLLRFIARRKWTFREINEKADKKLYQQMVEDCGANFLKWQFRSIMHWETPEAEINAQRIMIIHGEDDNVIRMKRLSQKPDIVIEDGTHKSVINHGREISEWINGLVREAT